MRLEDLPPAAQFVAKGLSRRILFRDEQLVLHPHKLPADAVPLPKGQGGTVGATVQTAVSDSVRRARQSAMYEADEHGFPIHVDEDHLFYFDFAPTAIEEFLKKMEIDTTYTLFRRIDNFGLCFSLGPVFHHLDKLYHLPPHQKNRPAYHAAFAHLVVDEGLLTHAGLDHLSQAEREELATWLAHQFPEACALFHYVSECLYDRARNILTNNGEHPQIWQQYLAWTGIASLPDTEVHTSHKPLLLAVDEIHEPRITLADYLLIAHGAFTSFTQNHARAAPAPPPPSSPRSSNSARPSLDHHQKSFEYEPEDSTLPTVPQSRSRLRKISSAVVSSGSSVFRRGKSTRRERTA
ncbi:hypothetical protein JCM6882_003245 [Rhodosporidiobolus microsporus]